MRSKSAITSIGARRQPTRLGNAASGAFGATGAGTTRNAHWTRRNHGSVDTYSEAFHSPASLSRASGYSVAIAAAPYLLRHPRGRRSLSRFRGLSPARLRNIVSSLYITSAHRRRAYITWGSTSRAPLSPLSSGIVPSLGALYEKQGEVVAKPTRGSTPLSMGRCM